MIGPIVRAVGGLIVKETPALVKYTGKRLLPAVSTKVARSSSSIIRRTVSTQARSKTRNLLAGAVTSPSVEQGFFKKMFAKTPGWLKKSVTFAGEVVAFNEITELIFGPSKEGAEAGTAGGSDSAKENALSNLLVANGHSKLLETIDNVPNDEELSNSRVNDLTDIVTDLFTSRNSICGTDLTYSISARVNALGPNERALIITRLACIMKHVAIGSDDPEIFLLMANQAMASGMTNASPTNGFERVINSNPVERRKAGIKAAEFNAMFNALGDELAGAAYDEFFDSHSSIWDFFDTITYDGDDEIEGEDSSVAARICRLVTDDSVGASLSILEKFTLDSDGEDDETRALNRTIEYSRLSNAYLDFVIGGSLRSQFIMDSYLSK